MKYVLTALLLLSNVAFAQFVDGTKLSQLSEANDRMDGPNSSHKDFAESLQFMGYLTGVADVGEGVLFCTPTQSKVRQLAAVVRKYLRNNPEQWSKAGDTLVIAALREAFPCKKP